MTQQVSVLHSILKTEGQTGGYIEKNNLFGISLVFGSCIIISSY